MQASRVGRSQKASPLPPAGPHKNLRRKQGYRVRKGAGRRLGYCSTGLRGSGKVGGPRKEGETGGKTQKRWKRKAEKQIRNGIWFGNVRSLRREWNTWNPLS